MYSLLGFHHSSSTGGQQWTVQVVFLLATAAKIEVRMK
jgi:hypothetical protein